MTEKKNKIIIICVTVVAVVLIAVIAVVLIKNSQKETAESGDGGIVLQADYSEPDVIVEYGDYDMMRVQSKAIQNGEMLGKTIRVEGIVSHPMTTYSIVQENEDGSKIGTEFVIEGLDEDGYPQDGERVVISGEVAEKSTLYYVIKTRPEFVEVVEEGE